MPSGVELSAMGFVAPQPLQMNFSAGMPRLLSSLAMARARFMERDISPEGLPVDAVWPSTRNEESFALRRTLAILSRRSFSLSKSWSLSGLNWRFFMLILSPAGVSSTGTSAGGSFSFFTEVMTFLRSTAGG